MRIAYFTKQYPWPQSSGTRRRIAAQLEVLRRWADITLVTPEVIDSPPEGLAVRRAKGAPPRSQARKAVTWVRHPGLPWSSDPRDRGFADALDVPADVDLVWVHRIELWAALHARLPAGVPIVIDADDYEYARKSDMLEISGARTALAPLRTIFLGSEMRRYQSLMNRAVGECVVAFSNPDHVASLDNTALYVRNATMPLGPCVSRTDREFNASIGFFGLLSYQPNLEAAIRLASGLSHRLQHAVPGTRVRIIGRVPEGLAGRLDAAGIEAAGYVRDLHQELRSLDALIVPVSSGSGTRVKVVDAMSVGLPVISTPFGVEGLGLVDGENVLMGETDAELAGAWAAFAGNPALRSKLSRNACVKYQESFSLDALEADLARALAAAGVAPP